MNIPTNIPGYFGKGSVEVAPPAADGEGSVRRLAITSGHLVTQPAAGVDTIPDIVAYAARRHGTRQAMGYRDVIQEHEEEKEIKRSLIGRRRHRRRRGNTL